MKRTLVLSAVFLAGLFAARADDLTPKIDSAKVSTFADKQFDVKSVNGFGGAAAGFDKTYATPGGADSLIQKTANLGGREVYGTSIIDVNKTYATHDMEGFNKVSPLDGQMSPMSGRPSPLPMEAKVKDFDHMVFDDKEYRGREADRIRDAIDRMQTQSQSALSQQMAQSPGGTESKKASREGDKTIASGPRQIAPVINIDDVKLLINKDVAPTTSWTAQTRIEPAHAEGAVTPETEAPQTPAAPSAEALKP
jgi:hypothetical protein